METPQTDSHGPNAAELERSLDAAKRQKTLAQVPALRRLRMVVRALVVMGLLGQVAVVIPVGWSLGQMHSIVEQLGLGISSFLALIVYAVTTSAFVATTWLLLLAYARFATQFRKNHVLQIEDTTSMILRLFRYTLAFLTVTTLVLPAAIYQNLTMTLASAAVGAFALVVQGLMYLVVRRYVKTARAELPALIAAAGDDPVRGIYQSWKALFLRFVALAVLVVSVGYYFGKAATSFDHFLETTAATLNATAPIQVDSQTRLDKVTSGPGYTMTYFYTLVDVSVDDATRVSEILKPKLVDNYKTNSSLAPFRTQQVEFHYVYRDTNGKTIVTIDVSPKDF